MRIAVDARELAGKPTGVGRYLAELLACWSRDPRAAGHEILLLTPGLLRLPVGLIGTGGARVDSHVIPGNSPGANRGGIGHLLWEQRPLPAAAVKLRADVLFCPGYSGPIVSKVPVVVSIHDVSFWAHPEWFNFREGLRRRLTTWASAYCARLVLTLTAFSRDEIIRWLDVDAARVRAITPGAGGFFDPAARSEGAPSLRLNLLPKKPLSPNPSPKERGLNLASQGLESPLPDVGRGPDHPPKAIPSAGSGGMATVLTVGSIFNRRHVDHLIAAFARIAPRLPDARLVVVGENRTYPHQDLDALIRELRVTDRVELRSYVSDEELLALYGQARAFAFLSTYEGFGLTPVEAIISGVPAVVYDSEVARETLSGLARFVPAGDIDALAAQLHAMLTAELDRDQQSALARAARMRYPWARTAAETLAALEEAARP
jgi:glycosyltransferase involved in cell wall biosynthesis